MKRPFFDTTVLLGGLVDLGESSVGPMAVLDALAAGETATALTAWHCCLEFYSVATRLPEEYRLSPVAAHTLLKEEVFPRFKMGSLPAGSRLSFLAEVEAAHISGGRIYDHHIASIANAMSATVVVTENTKHFIPVMESGVPVMTAREFLTQLA